MQPPVPEPINLQDALMPTVEKIIEAHGGMDWLKEGPLSNYIRLENPPYMRLVIEHIGPGPRGHDSLSVAHYYEQNGDAMRDPEIVFEVTDDGWEPVSYLQDGLGVYREAVELLDFRGHEGPQDPPFTPEVVVNQGIVDDLKCFASMWDSNIASQGFLDRCPKPAKPLCECDKPLVDFSGKCVRCGLSGDALKPLPPISP